MSSLKFVSLLFVCALWNSAVKAAETRHGFLACGKNTYILDADGQIVWTYPQSTRDGYVLPMGRIVLAVNKSKTYPGGAVIEVARDGTEALIWKGTQSEVNSVQPTEAGSFVLSEAGPKPRLLEVDRSGKVLVEFPLDCQLDNHHMQTRMSRKLADDTYLVPHLLDFAVRNYDSQGRVLSSLDTTAVDAKGVRDAEHAIHTWPFTAIRHGEGHTLVCCTNGNTVVDFDAAGKVVWRLTNDDLPGPWLQDPCGAQVLPNGNFVITSYAAGSRDPQAPKLIEVTRDKEVVWTYANGEKVGIHHFQILDTNGRQLDGPVLK